MIHAAIVKKEFILAAVIFLVASLSFALGYLICRSFNHSSIVIEQCSDTFAH